MVSTETRPSLIPMDEIAELRAIIDMKQKDEIFNKTEIHNYIDSLVERFGDVLNVLTKPIVDKVMEQMGENENVEENDYLEVIK
jgi:hypothetical protein